MKPTKNILKMLGTHVMIPLQHPVASLDTETLQNLKSALLERFSDFGRQQFARNVCESLQKYGFSVPKDTTDSTYSEYPIEVCADIVLDIDYEEHTEDMLTETIDFLDEIIALKTGAKQQTSIAPGMQP